MKVSTAMLMAGLLLGCPTKEAPPSQGTTPGTATSNSTDNSESTEGAAAPESSPPASESESEPATGGSEPGTGTTSELGTGATSEPGTGATSEPGTGPATEAKVSPPKTVIPAGKKYKRCKEMRPVTKGDPKTAEGTLWLVFQALLMEDDDAAFEGFFSHIDPELQRRDSARRYWFGAARKYGGKNFHRLVFSPKDPSYVVCEVRPESGGVRIFVGKSPPVGSNPPYSFHKVKDKWLLKTFTPH